MSQDQEKSMRNLSGGIPISINHKLPTSSE